MRRMAWCAVAAGFTLLAGINGTIWPNLGKTLELTAFQIGLGAMAVSVQIPLFSLVWALLRRHLQHPWMLLSTTGR